MDGLRHGGHGHPSATPHSILCKGLHVPRGTLPRCNTVASAIPWHLAYTSPMSPRLPILTIALVLLVPLSACAQKAKVDRALSDSARQAAAGVTDLDAATDTGEVGPQAEPFRSERTGTLCVDSTIIRPGQGGPTAPQGGGVGGVVGTHGAGVDGSGGGHAVPVVADGAARPDPWGADVHRANVDPGSNAGGGVVGGPGTRPEPARDDARTDRGEESNRSSVRRSMETRGGEVVAQTNGATAMTAITTAIVWGVLGFLAGAAIGGPVISLIQSKLKK